MRLLFLFTLVAVGIVLPGISAEETRRFVQSEETAATYKLTLVCSLEGVFSKESRVFYFRPPRQAFESGKMSTVMSHADGDGIGYGFSARADPKNTAVEIEVSVYWTSKNAHGKSEVTLLVPYFEEKKGRDAGLGYSLTWQKLK